MSDPLRVLLIAPEIEDSMPSRLKEALSRRRLVITTGRCPCGARPQLPQQDGDGLWQALTIHDDGCCAPAAEKLYRKWQRQQRKRRP